MKYKILGSLFILFTVLFANGDLTDDSVVSVTSSITAEGSKVVENIIDNDINTVFLTDANEKVDPSCDITVELDTEKVIKGIGFVSGYDKPERDPKTIIIKGSNDNASWKEIAELEIDNSDWARKTLKEFYLANETAYKFILLQIDNQSEESTLFGTNDRLQIGELELYSDVHYMVDVTDLADVIVSAQYEGSGSVTSSKLIDNDASTQYVSDDGENVDPNCWLQFDFPVYNCLKKITITSGSGSDVRDPKSVVIEADDNGTWVRLDSIYIEEAWARKETREFDVTNDERYQSYRLVFENTGVEGLFGNKRRLAIGEIEFYSTKIPPIPDFEINLVVPTIETGNSIQFTSTSVGATEYLWNFEGGNPATSTEPNPSVVYETEGVFNVSLTATNEYGSYTITREELVTVKADYPWAGFNYPEVVVENYAGEHRGVELYTQLCKDNGFKGIEEFVQSCCLLMAEKIYYTVEEANAHNVQKITYKLNDGGSLSYKGGSPPFIEVGFDVNYIVTFYNAHTAEQAVQEVLGVLCHELTHAYQIEPKNCGSYVSGDEYYGYIEGMADLGRLNTGGFNPERHPSPGGQWNDGYNTTAFWYLWLQRTQAPLNGSFEKDDFIKELNLTAQNMQTWSHENMCQALFGKSATDLWNQYQAETGSYPWLITAIDDELLTLNHFELKENYPNPFNPTTNINFTIPSAQHVEIGIFNLLGERVATLANQQYQSGNYTLQWNGKNDFGQMLPSGVYFYRMDTEAFNETRKMMLMK